MAHLPAIRIRAPAGLTSSQVEDTIHDQPAGFEIRGCGVAVEARYPWGLRGDWQGRPRPDRHLLLSFGGELRLERRLIGDGAWGIGHGGLAPGIEFVPQRGIF